MRYQQVLALCLLACLAYGTLAYEKGYDEKEKYDYEKDYYKNSYDGYDDYDKKPDCGPDTFPELKEPTCIDPDSGKCVPYDPDWCRETSDYWCRKVNKKWGCKYHYKPKDTQCREKKGDCDVADFCPGDSATCPDKVKDKDTVCKKWNQGPCILDSKCDGVVKFCPGKHKAPIGTPCGDDSLYEEAYDDTGKVYTLATEGGEAETLAKKHGWTKCHRCYKGECVPFKYEWWKKEKKHKHHKSDEDWYSDKSYDGYKMYDDDESYYETKTDTKAKAEGYEPDVYCKSSTKSSDEHTHIA